MPTLSIVKNEKATSVQWDTITSQSPYATFYHSREWAELWEQYTDGAIKPAARYITFTDGVEVLYPMCVYRVLKGLMRQYISSPGWMHGGWLSLAPLSKHHVALLWRYSTTLNIIIRQNPLNSAFDMPGLNLCEYGYTQVLDLRSGFDALNNFWAKEHKSILRNKIKAQKLGITIDQAQNLEDWRTYYEVYQASIQRWGSAFEGPLYDWPLFKKIYYRNSPNLKLWLARYEGQVVAGTICLYQNKHATAWHGAADQSYFKYKPFNLLDYTVIKKCCEEGYLWLDFGPSGHSSGVIAYKAGWGCQKVVFNAYINKKLNRQSIDLFKSLYRRFA